MAENLNIAQRMLKVMEAIESLPKDMTNSHHGYKYTSERTVKDAVRKELIKNGILFAFNTSNLRVENNVTVIDVNYQFINVNNVTDFFAGNFVATGPARDDKGNWAAVTGAIKYIMTSNFLIPTGGDPEEEDGGSKGGTTTRPTEQTQEKGNPDWRYQNQDELAAAADAKDVKCPACGSEMALKEGKNGKFWGCTEFSKTGCKGARKVNTGAKIASAQRSIMTEGSKDEIPF